MVRNNVVTALILMLTMTLPVFAGNKSGTQPVISSKDNKSLGYRADYVQNKDQVVLFDKDISNLLATEIVDYLNTILVDIRLVKQTSKINYVDATELNIFGGGKDKRYAKNRIFVFLGSGFNSDFFATPRVYDSNEPTCFIGLRDNLWDTATESTKKNILTHELFHCLGWDHPENNPYVSNFDFVSNDNVEVLKRLHDKFNKNHMVTVNLFKHDLDVVGFIGKKDIRTNVTTYTRDNEVKLFRGRYKVQLNGMYIRKINRKGKMLFTSNIRKAKKFDLRNVCEIDLFLKEMI